MGECRRIPMQGLGRADGDGGCGGQTGDPDTAPGAGRCIRRLPALDVCVSVGQRASMPRGSSRRGWRCCTGGTRANASHSRCAGVLLPASLDPWSYRQCVRILSAGRAGALNGCASWHLNPSGPTDAPAYEPCRHRNLAQFPLDSLLGCCCFAACWCRCCYCRGHRRGGILSSV